MRVFFYCLLILIIFIAVWVVIPYSPLKAEFERSYRKLTARSLIKNQFFTEELLSKKPELLKRYIKYCGLYNKPMMSYSVTIHKGADFLMKEGSSMIKILYKQVNFATICERLALIDMKMGVLPFQGFDHNINGKGSMKGVIGKLFTVFNVKGKEMDISSLVTVLAEGIVCPSFLMHEAISWEEIDSTRIKATLSKSGLEVSGIFEFDNEGAIISFYTKDRFQENQGKMIKRDWKAQCGEYKFKDGIKRPTTFKGSWMNGNEELIYFNCNDVQVDFY